MDPKAVTDFAVARMGESSTYNGSAWAYLGYMLNDIAPAAAQAHPYAQYAMMALGLAQIIMRERKK